MLDSRKLLEGCLSSCSLRPAPAVHGTSPRDRRGYRKLLMVLLWIPASRTADPSVVPAASLPLGTEPLGPDTVAACKPRRRDAGSAPGPATGGDPLAAGIYNWLAPEVFQLCTGIPLAGRARTV